MAVQGAELEPEIRRVGHSLAAAVPSAGRNPLRALDDKAMDVAERDEQLRAALFRLVDVTPACRSLDDLAEHLVGYLDEVEERSTPLDAATRMAGSRAGRKALGAAAAAGVRHMAHRFVVGESPRAALKPIGGLWRSGIASSVDLLGEATVTEEEAERYAGALPRDAGGARRRRRGMAGAGRARERLDWSNPARKCVGEGHGPDAAHAAGGPAVGRDDAARRLGPLLRTARDLEAHLHVDMESVNSLETTEELLFALLEENDLRDGPSVGLVLQAYLRDSPAVLGEVLDWVERHPRGRPLVIRLVKGAYWDHEVVEARQHGWRPPVFESKAECDRNFEALAQRLLEARPLVRVAIASHNLRSIAHAIAANRALGGDDRDLELQVLRGLGDELAEALAREGFRVRSYCPVGDLVAGMAYLVRRLLENTANESFLRSWREGAELDELLAAP